MGQKYAELQKLSREDLVREYDRAGEHVPSLSVAFVREEIARRDLAEQNASMERMTRDMRNLTRWIAGLTVLIFVLTLILVLAET